MQHILAVGSDHSLLYTRSLLLEKSGASITISTFAQALPLLSRSTFHLLLMCHSLSDGEVQHLCVAASHSPVQVGTLLLEIPGEASRALVHVDSRFASEGGPYQLIKAVRTLIDKMEKEHHSESVAGNNLLPFNDARIPPARSPLLGRSASAHELLPFDTRPHAWQG